MPSVLRPYLSVLSGVAQARRLGSVARQRVRVVRTRGAAHALKAFPGLATILDENQVEEVSYGKTNCDRKRITSRFDQRRRTCRRHSIPNCQGNRHRAIGTLSLRATQGWPGLEQR